MKSFVVTGVFAWFLLKISFNNQLVSAMLKYKTSNNNATRKPNLILFLADDFGYGDLSVFGHPTQEWGPVDDMAMNGMKFTQFYATSAFCSPSRVAVLTGRLPRRIGAFGDKPVFMPGSSTGLPLVEETLADTLKELGYQTGMVGKWHLGTNKHHHTDQHYFPHQQGFDFVGTFLPFTLEDTCDEEKHFRFEAKRSKCYLFYNKTMIQQPINLENLTPTMVHDAKAFIYESADKPFFLFFSLLQTHIPFFNHPDFAGKSRRGPYGDQMNEMQWAVGEVLQLVKNLGLDEDTMSLFVSDHGAQRELCAQGGNNGPFFGGKANFYEGGLRVPAIVHWPGVVPAGTVKTDVMSTLDILPTFRQIAGAEPNPKGVLLDGKSFHQTLFDKNDTCHHKTLLFFCNEHLVAARHSSYKVHFAFVSPPDKMDYQTLCSHGIPHTEHIMERNCDKYHFLPTPVIYNVEEDPGEDFPLSLEKYSDVIDQVKIQHEALLQTIPKDTPRLFDFEYMTNSLIPCCNPPYCTCNYSVKK